MTIFTIGHGNGSERDLINNLLLHEVKVLVDVRSSPYSKHASHFNYNNIRSWLPAYGVSYEFMGDCLGGIPQKKEYLDLHGKPDYEKMARDDWFIDGMDRLMKMAEENVICVMCSEEDPARCHRARLIAERLAASGATIQHIRADGSLESEADNAKRRFKPADNQMDLFS